MDILENGVCLFAGIVHGDYDGLAQRYGLPGEAVRYSYRGRTVALAPVPRHVVSSVLSGALDGDEDWIEPISPITALSWLRSGGSEVEGNASDARNRVGGWLDPARKMRDDAMERGVTARLPETAREALFRVDGIEPGRTKPEPYSPVDQHALLSAILSGDGEG